MSRRLVLPSAAFALAGFGEALAAERPLPDQPPLPPRLSELSSAALHDAAGRPVTLGGLLGAPRAAVVSFWATWCAPCAQEGRHLAEIRADYPEVMLAMVGINVDAAPDAAKLAAFRQKARMNYAQGLAGAGAYQALTRTTAIALPRTYVFDGSGAPVAAFGRFYGDRTLRAIDAAVTEALRRR